MTLLLSDNDVANLVDPLELIKSIESSLIEESAGGAVIPRRVNIDANGTLFRIGPAFLPGSGFMGFKAFHGRQGDVVRYVVCLYDEARGDLLAIMDANNLTAARTGAVTGLATNYLASRRARSVGIIGAGAEARTNLAAIAAVRSIDAVRVYSPRTASRQNFARYVEETIGIECRAVDTPQKAVFDAEIVVVATNTRGASDPIAYRGAWMRPGQHINSIGSTNLALREIDPAAFARPDVVVVDTADMVLEESADVLAAVAEGSYPDVVELKDVIGGAAVGRDDTDETMVTLFKSVGTGGQDVAAAAVVYRKALETGHGQDLGEVLVAKNF
ncbi:ornithine cyclodeaminase family protein [Nocardia sp. CWNU-33]|uniref:ornithine cyclodeaminase family protein n=1 Tax=Nocardia sp. CWNU-33 TaxID=3392117 RepID=UPI00398F59B7